MEELSLYLHPTDLNQSVWRFNAISHIGELDLLRSTASHAEVKVFVNAEDVLLLQATLPEMSRARLLQAVPYALEEELISDVEELHFALGEQYEDGKVTVSVVAKEKMQQWLEQLTKLGVTPHWMGTAIFALPYNVNVWPAAIFDDKAIFRNAMFVGSACDKQNLSVFLQAAINESDIKPELVNVRNYTKQPLAAMQAVPFKESHEEYVNFLQDVACESKVVGINLLQGKFASKHKSSFKFKHGFKLAAIFGITFIIMLFLKPIVANIILGRKLNQENLAIATIYKRYFPESTTLIAPKERLTEKWQQLATGNSDNQVLMLLADMGRAMRDSAPVQLKRFDYQSDQTNIELVADSSETFAQFTDALRKLGLNVKEDNANLVEGKLNANIQITAS